MKKIILIPILLIWATSFSQSRILSGFDPSNGRPGYKYYDTLRNLRVLSPLYNVDDTTIGIDTSRMMAIAGPVTNATSGSVFYAGTGGRLQQSNSNFFYDSTNIRLGLGTSAPATKIHIIGNGAQSIRIQSYDAGTSTRGGIDLDKYSGTVSSPAAAFLNQSIGYIGFRVYDGTNMQLPALVEGFVDGSVSSGVTPARLSFVTGSNGATRKERLIIRNNGFIEANEGVSISSSLLVSGTDKMLIGNGSTSVATGLSLLASSSAAADRGTLKFVRSRGTSSSPTTVANSDESGSVAYGVFDGTNTLITARVTGLVNGTVSTGFVPTDLIFTTGATNQITGISNEKMRILSGGNVGIGSTNPTDKLEVAGNVALNTAGNKLKIAIGSNASIGLSAAMTAGTITINTTAVTANSIIMLTPVGAGSGQISLGTKTAGTSFVINSSDGADTRQVQWWIVN